MREKILVTPRSYGADMPELFERLAAAGCEVVRNDSGGILGREQMMRLIADCSGIIVGVDPLDAQVLSRAPSQSTAWAWTTSIWTTAALTAYDSAERRAQTARPWPITPWR